MKTIYQLSRYYALLFVAVISTIQGLNAQDAGGGFNLAVHHTGIGFGNSKKFSGLRFNYRDRNVEKINGINLNLWYPYEHENTGTNNGLLIGLPVGGARNVNGIALGLFGIGAEENLSGIQFGGLGLGSGNNVKGISIGGLGIGSGKSVSGISIAGLGIGSGDDLRGFQFAGLGVGAGDDVYGLSIAGLGLGAGGKVTGINLAGVGIGAGEGVRGLNIAGVAIGSGGGITGLNIAGVALGAGDYIKGINITTIAMGAGKSIKGINIAGVAMGSDNITGLNVASVMGAQRIQGVSIAPLYLQVKKGGLMKGLSISPFNHIRGEQHGVSIGVFNYARKLKGFQIGLLNYIKENPILLRLMPLINFSFKD